MWVNIGMTIRVNDMNGYVQLAQGQSYYEYGGNQNNFSNMGGPRVERIFRVDVMFGLE